jgi:transposase InsO family protein
LEIAPSTYWSAKTRPPSARAVADAVLIPVLVALFVNNYSVYGRRKLTKAARKAGHDVGRDQIARLMRVAGIRGASRARKRFTTRPDPTAVRAADLVRRDFTAARPDQIWVADFERHEALSNRAVVKGHRHGPVAAGALELRAA